MLYASEKERKVFSTAALAVVDQDTSGHVIIELQGG